MDEKFLYLIFYVIALIKSKIITGIFVFLSIL